MNRRVRRRLATAIFVGTGFLATPAAALACCPYLVSVNPSEGCVSVNAVVVRNGACA